MALADPQTFTYNSHPATLGRTGMTANSSTYAGTTGDGQFSFQMTQNASNSKRRRSARLVWTRNVPDPIVPANNRVTENAATIVFETPTIGSDSLTDLAFASAFVDFLNASSKALVASLVSGAV